MDFVLTPDNGAPRLVRYRTLEPPTVCTVDMKHNVLVVNKPLFDRLDGIKRQLVITSRVSLQLADLGYGVTKLEPITTQ